MNQHKTQGERFRWARKALAQSPVAGVIRANEQKYVATVGQFMSFFIRFSCTDFSAIERQGWGAPESKRGINFIESDDTRSCTLVRDLLWGEVD